MATDLELVQTALTEFSRVGAGLAILTKNYSGVLYEVDTPKGMEHAKAARRALRDPRIEVEKIRKEAKAPLLAIGKKLDTEAARITAAIMLLEDPIDQQIKTEEARKEREKAEAVAAEAKRISDLQNRIAGIRNMALIPASCGSEAILARHDATKALPIEGFAELTAEATAAKDQTVAILFGLHSSAVAAEAEAARIAAERGELAKLRAEQEARNLEARKAQEAEQARQAEENRRAREQLERDRAEQEAAAKVERDRLAAERAEQERQAEHGRMLMSEIEGIRHQAMIAAVGRAGVRAGGTVQCAEETLAETESWVIDPDHFGVLTTSAQAIKASTIAQIREVLAQRQKEAQEAEARKAEDERIAHEREQLARDQEAARLAAMPKPAATKRPADAEIVKVVADHFGVEPGVAMGWLASFKTEKAQKAA